MTALGNFFCATDETLIKDNMLWDKNKDLKLGRKIYLSPVLTQSSAETPRYGACKTTQPPTMLPTHSPTEAPTSSVLSQEFHADGHEIFCYWGRPDRHITQTPRLYGVRPLMTRMSMATSFPATEVPHKTKSLTTPVN